MIPTYNCANSLAQTLCSVLRQDPGPDVMQIEVVDDHSERDDPERVTREVGAGRVSFFRQPNNVGHVRNFNTCLQRSRGTLVHLLHGDDAVRDGFYETLGAAFERDASIGAAFCRFIAMDDAGHWQTIGPLMADGDPPGVRSPQPENTRLITTNMKTIARTTATTTVTITCFTGRSCAIVTAADLSATPCRDRDAFCPSATPPRSSRPPRRRPRAPSA